MTICILQLSKGSRFIAPKRLKGRYKETINNPQFPFPIHQSLKPRTAVQVKWNDFFDKQRRFSERPKFVLHDGPPYSNGELHVGHALNKCLKDITIRYNLLRGYRVHFVPGWDCHGLPIELKAAAKIASPSSGQIREKAAGVARHYIKKQKSSFLSWGILGEWHNHYTTMDPTFEAMELNAFSTLYSKNLIYRHLLPVHWSGQSRTALAESELEYNPEHTSKSLYLKLKLLNAAERFPHIVKGESKVFAVVWTTTPWTLPANEAISYDPTSRYVLLKVIPSGELYLVGKNFVDRLSTLLSGLKTTIVDEFNGSQLAGLFYLHPVRSTCQGEEQLSMPFLPASHVTDTVGTGLVHCAPCHGKEDFEVGRSFNLPMHMLVDENACFKMDVDHRLAGRSVLSDGNEKVLEIVRPMTLLVENIQHSYPYDWRTKTPIITRVSEQWFLDTQQLSESALEAYDSITVLPSSHKPSMIPFLTSRPRWCLSRQRVWGVPIPVLFRRSDNTPIVDCQFIRHISDRVAQSGTDFWFTEPVSHLVPDRFCDKWSLTPDEIEKSTDVFDVWFDSGLSWLCVLNKPDTEVGNCVADMYLEGPDQFRGWFSTSLLLSVALQGKAPYRKLVVHGFTADSEGRKMSKSVGNVVSPEQLINDQNGCVDVLRRWAAFSALDAVCSVGSKEMEQHAASYKMLRNGLRFLLGNLHDFDPLTQFHRIAVTERTTPNSVNQLLISLTRVLSRTNGSVGDFNTLDLAILCWLGRLVTLATDHSYPNYRFDTLLAEVDKFVSRLSSVYFTSVKDVLYCNAADSSERRATQTIFWLTMECLKLLLAPLLPYLMEEVEEISCRQWPISSAVRYPTVCLLERWSADTSQEQRPHRDEPSSDWSVCVNAMRQWTGCHQSSADAVELVHSLHHNVIILLDVEPITRSSGSAVTALSNSHVSISVGSRDSDIYPALKLLHPEQNTISTGSALCRLFRSASIRWSLQATEPTDPPAHSTTLSFPFQGTDLVITLQPASADTRCPRCLRHTRTTRHEPLCARCSHVLSDAQRLAEQ